MKRPGKHWRRLVLALLVLPPALWALVLAIAPTEWARRTVAGALSQAVHQPVQIGGVRLGVLGGIQVLDLQIGPPVPELGPWLRASEIQLDLSPLQVLAGRVEPTACRASGLSLRVRRLADGSLEFADLFQSQGDAPASNADQARDPNPPVMAIELSETRVLFLDEMSGTKLDLANVAGRGHWRTGQLQVEQLDGTLNGGRFAMAARLDWGDSLPSYEGEVRIEHAQLDAGMRAITYLVPILAGSPESVALQGRLDLDLFVQTKGNSGAEIARNLAGQGNVALDEIDVDGSRVLSQIASALRMPDQGRIGSIRGDFAIANRRVATKNLALQVGPLPLTMVGWTDFDGRIDYLARTQEITSRLGALTDRLPPETRQWLGELPGAIQQMANLRIQGTVQSVALSVDGLRLDEWVDRAGSRVQDDFQRLRDLGRRIRSRDRLRR